MPSVAYKKLFEPTILTTGAVTIFTLNTAAGATTSTILSDLVLRVVNYTAGAITVTGYAIASGGSASDDEYFVKEASVPANDYILVTVPVMAYNGFIQLLASAGTSITVHHESGAPKTP